MPFAANWSPDVAGRAERESIRELKADLSLTPVSSLDATVPHFDGRVLCNLLMGFRETVLPVCWFRTAAAGDTGSGLSGRSRSGPRSTTAGPIRRASEERAEFLERLRTLRRGCRLRRSWTGI
ncbi:MAG: hypothetical protein IPK92_14820 [Nitrospira sp.]|nr:hypothetical protein [Nitrospira sp.]